MTTYKHLENFASLKPFYDITNGKFRHNTFTSHKINPDMAQRRKFKHTWFFKQVADTTIGLREVVAQEYFRLIIPGQPKTRLVKDKTGSHIYVISKEIPQFTSLHN